MKKKIASLFLLTLLGGCNYNHVHGDAADADPAGASASILSASLDYPSVQAAVIGPQCLRCHSGLGGNQGGLSLESYAQVRTALARIYFRSVERRDMPPSPGLNVAQFDLLKAWIEAGAPERNLGRSSSREIRGPITWIVIKEQVLKSSCLDCHSGRNPDGNLDFENYDVVKSNIEKIFRSAVVDQTMPLEPYPALSLSEKQALMKWISQGLPR